MATVTVVTNGYAEHTAPHNTTPIHPPPAAFLPHPRWCYISTYSVCKVNSVTPEVTFKRIIEQYKQLSSTSGGALNGGVGTPRLSVIKDILLQAGADGREQDRGDIIKFYNKVNCVSGCLSVYESSAFLVRVCGEANHPPRCHFPCLLLHFFAHG